jgi:hypothetical protein
VSRQPTQLGLVLFRVVANLQKSGDSSSPSSNWLSIIAFSSSGSLASPAPDPPGASSSETSAEPNQRGFDAAQHCGGQRDGEELKSPYRHSV